LVKALYFGTLVNWVVLAMVLLAATRLAEPFLLWDEWLPNSLYHSIRQIIEWLGVSFFSADADVGTSVTRSTNNILSIGMILLVTLCYSTTGGLRSVVNTDIVQFVLAMIASAAFAWCVVDRVGGLDQMLALLQDRFSDGSSGTITASQILAFTPSQAKDVSFTVLLVIALQWLLQMNADGTGYLAQRTMACRSDRDATQAAIVFTVAQVLFRSLIWVPLGLGLLVLFPIDPQLPLAQLSADREFSFVRGMIEVLPPGLLGLMLTGMVAAFASTVDTQLNWGAGYWTNDLYNRFLCGGLLRRVPSGRELVWVARLSNLITVAGAVSIVPFLPSIQAAWHLSLLFGAGLGIVLVLRWIWWRLTAWGELASIIGSAVLAPLMLSVLSDEEDAARVLMVATGATVAGVAVSLLTKPEPMQALCSFYISARPPGFWEPVARAAGESGGGALRQWKAGIRTIAMAGLSIFCLLIGIGSWLVGSPPPSWFPWRDTWIGGLLIIGVLLCPSWASYLIHPFKEEAPGDTGL
jgi:Na+/proline symporter